MKKILKEDLEDINYRGQDLVMTCPSCGSENLEGITGDIDGDGNLSYVKYKCKDCLSIITANIDIDCEEPECPYAITIRDDNGPDDFEGIEDDIDLSDAEIIEYARNEYDLDEYEEGSDEYLEALDNARDELSPGRIQKFLDKECDEINNNYECSVAIDYDSHHDWRIDIDSIENYAALKKFIEDGEGNNSWIHHLIYYYLIDDLESGDISDENYSGFKLRGSGGHKYYY